MRFKTAKPAAEGRDARPRRVVKGRCASAAKGQHDTSGQRHPQVDAAARRPVEREPSMR